MADYLQSFTAKRSFAPLSGRTQSGYGRRIPTDYMVNVDRRWYRVYCMIYSNVGTLYIIRKGERMFIRESDLEFALEKVK